MTLRLNGSTSGYTEIDAPAVAGSNTITLPTGAGSANQFLKNGATAGSLGWSSMVETATGVGIGTSPSYKLHVSGNNAVSADNTIAMSYGRAANPTDALHKITWGSDDLRIEADTANTIASNITFHNDGTERARITSDGRFGVNATNFANGRLITESDGTAITPFVIRDTAAGTSSVNSVGFFRNATQVGSIALTGSATAYNTSSDYRLKENVVAVTDGITRLQQLKPSRFNFIADPDKTVDGFIAHEAQAVVPECVTGDKDAEDADGNPVYQGIDQSKLVPLLTAALQETIAKIETLEARLTALEVTP
jgi:hypothetical protein